MKGKNERGRKNMGKEEGEREESKGRTNWKEEIIKEAQKK
jgi:hypothetical protein